MPSSEPKRNAARTSEEIAETLSYWDRSRRPLEILVFLLPFILLYEIGMIYLLRQDTGTITNLAHKLIMMPMDSLELNPFSLSMPAVIVIVVLLVWHLLTRAPWRIEPVTLLLMLVEAVLLTLPLLVASRFVHQLLPMMAEGEELLGSLDAAGLVAMSIGAGLYEELLFRMLVVFVVHTLMVDVLKSSEAWGITVAVVVSTALFAIYHPPIWNPDGGLSPGHLGFYLFAGLWFSLVYVFRGFGVVVAVHVFYDVVVLLDAN